jgi:hypothetical protein
MAEVPTGKVLVKPVDVSESLPLTAGSFQEHLKVSRARQEAFRNV